MTRFGRIVGKATRKGLQLLGDAFQVREGFQAPQLLRSQDGIYFFNDPMEAISLDETVWRVQEVTVANPGVGTQTGTWRVTDITDRKICIFRPQVTPLSTNTTNITRVGAYVEAPIGSGREYPILLSEAAQAEFDVGARWYPTGIQDGFFLNGPPLFLDPLGHLKFYVLTTGAAVDVIFRFYVGFAPPGVPIQH